MEIWRTKVPSNKKLLIGHYKDRDIDFVGFVDKTDTKYVNVSASIYSELTDDVCVSCDIYSRRQVEENKFRESYKNLFLIHPEMCVDFLKNNRLSDILDNSGFYLQDPWYVYARKNLLTAEYFIDGLIKWKLYEYFVGKLVETWEFKMQVINKAIDKLYADYNKCRGYEIEDNHCKLNKKEFQQYRQIPCSHNTLWWLQEIDSSMYYLHDVYHDSACALPNVYGDGEICWGSRSKPENLQSAYSTFWKTPFNTDLLTSRDDDICFDELIEGYGFNACDFYPYDEDNDETDYEAEPRSFTASELVKIIKQGGDNPYKGHMELEYVEFDVPDVKEIAVIEDGREIPEFNEIIADNFLNHLDNDNNLYLFLINEIRDNVWQAYLPTDEEEGEYIEIDLDLIANYEENNNDD